MNLLEKIRYIFTRDQKIKFVILFFLIFVGALAETIGVSVILPFISIVTSPDSILEQPILAYIYNLFNMKSSNDFLIFLALFLIFVYIAKNLYMFVMYKLEFRFVYNNQMRMSVKLMDCYLKKPYEYHANKNSSEIVRSVTQDISNLFQLVLNAILLLTEVLVVTCVGTLLIIIEPVMTLATLVLLGSVLLIFIVIYKKRLRAESISYQKSNGLMIKWITQGLGGIKEIKVMRREQFFIDSYKASAAKFAEAQRKYSFLNQVPKLFIESASICGILIVISAMLYNGADISNMLPQLAAFAIAAFRIMPSFNRITIYYNTVVYYTASIDLVYRDLKDSEDALKNEMIDTNPRTNIRLDEGGAIKMNDLRYTYPNSNLNIFKDTTFEIPLKKSVAIIGASGSGKTTFADILLGLLHPSEGYITVDGVDIHKNLECWSSKLGYIPQNIYLCDDDIKSNVAFGIREDDVDEDKVWESLEKAQLKSFVEALPESIYTVIGEGGVRLSGGQRQRIGIARAFYNDPKVLVLDEATSALDNDTEAAVMEAIETVKNEKTLIIIAHRLSTIRNCDLVFKVESGKVILVKSD